MSIIHVNICMSNDLIARYTQRIGRMVRAANPYSPDTAEYAVYECGLLRALLARCCLNDSHNGEILERVVEAILESRTRE